MSNYPLDDYVGHKCQKSKTFSGGWALDPNSPPEVGQIPFALVDGDGEIIPDSEGWATPYGDDGAYDLGTATYHGEFWGVRLKDTGYVFKGERPRHRKKKGVIRMKFKKVFSPMGYRPRVLPTTAPV